MYADWWIWCLNLLQNDRLKLISLRYPVVLKVKLNFIKVYVICI